MPKSRTTNEPVFHPLDKNGFIPLYFQIQRALMEKIQSGELSEGDPLASEEELSRHYQVSRMTARQALHGLKTSGYAFSEKGRGTFVTRPKLEKNIMHLQGFTEEMRQRGMKPSSKLLDQAVRVPNEDLMQRLKLDPNDKVVHLRRRSLPDAHRRAEIYQENRDRQSRRLRENHPRCEHTRCKLLTRLPSRRALRRRLRHAPL